MEKTSDVFKKHTWKRRAGAGRGRLETAETELLIGNGLVEKWLQRTCSGGPLSGKLPDLVPLVNLDLN